MCSAASTCHANSLLESRERSSARSMLAMQIGRRDRLLDEVRRPCLHRLDRHRHVAVAGDHDGGQKDLRRHAAAAAAPGRPSRADRHRSAGSRYRTRACRPPGTPRRWRNPARSGHRPQAGCERRRGCCGRRPPGRRQARPSSGPDCAWRERSAAIGVPAAGVLTGSRPWIACVNSASFTGLLSCRHRCAAMALNALVEMSPVSMITGRSEPSRARKRRRDHQAIHPVGKVVVREQEVRADGAMFDQLHRRRAHRARQWPDGPHRTGSAPAAPALPGRPPRSSTVPVRRAAWAMPMSWAGGEGASGEGAGVERAASGEAAEARLQRGSRVMSPERHFDAEDRSLSRT